MRFLSQEHTSPKMNTKKAYEDRKVLLETAECSFRQSKQCISSRRDAFFNCPNIERVDPMKKWLTGLFAVLFLTGMLAGCSDAEENNATQPAETTESEETVVITVSENEGEEVIAEEDVPIEEGDLLLDVMEEHFDVEHEDGFVTSINGVAPEEGEQRAWMYYVNDEMPMVGAAEYELEPGDEVVFDLQAWE